MDEACITFDAPDLAELLDLSANLDLTDPSAAVARLEDELPFLGERIQGLGRALCAAMEAGTICDRGTDELRYSRLFGASDESHGLSADAVWMSGPGPHHTHPQGEIDLCFSTDGTPTFDGNPPGWTVYPPGSSHVPTVRGGSMMILYLLPGGAIEFTRR